MYFGVPIIPIVAIVCAFLVVMRVLKLKAQRERDRTLEQQFDGLHAELEARDRALARLEERVRVLERIVTDDSWKLKSEIDRLSA